MQRQNSLAYRMSGSVELHSNFSLTPICHQKKKMSPNTHSEELTYCHIHMHTLTYIVDMEVGLFAWRLHSGLQVLAGRDRMDLRNF